MYPLDLYSTYQLPTNTRYETKKSSKAPNPTNNKTTTTDKRTTMIGTNHTSKRKNTANSARSRSNSSTNSIASTSTATNSNKRAKFRAPGDYRGKIEDLRNEQDLLISKLEDMEKLKEASDSHLVNGELELRQMKDRVYEEEKSLEVLMDQCRQEMERAREKYRQQHLPLEHSNKQYEHKRAGFDSEINILRPQRTQIFTKLEEIKQTCVQLQTSVDTTSSTLSQTEAKLTAHNKELQERESKLKGAQQTVEDLTAQLEGTEARIFEIDTQLLQNERIRRKKHNHFQELKGNIRVFCRMRPSLVSERTHEGALVQVQFETGHDAGSDKMEFSEQVISSTVTNKLVNKTHTFSFDKIFTPDHSQADCFEEISQLVQSALDGYNVCIFAFGQTGSGKTFTMQGPTNHTTTTNNDNNDNDTSNMGMIPRAVHQIYQVAQKLSDRGWVYSMEGQFLEIYNEAIHDLLGDVSDYGKIKHEIRHEKNGRTHVADMTTVKLDSPGKVKSMLRKANHNRATGATLLNERSSRSHSVFILRLTGHNKTTGERTTGVLNLIDLAGSERLNASGATGDRLTETKAINKSLSCLGDVIHALAKNKEGVYIPYRNSKLTYLLQNSLGGNCKTLMFVNISPLTEHFGETLCSLRFATKVNSCRIGTAKKAK